MKQKLYRKEELTATRKGDLISEELLEEWIERWEELSKILPLEEAQEYFTLLALWGRFARLSPEYLERSEVRETLEQLVKEKTALSDDQIKAAVGLFDDEHWGQALRSVSSLWADEEIDADEMFDDSVSLISDLDDFGSVLAAAMKRNIVKISDESSPWSHFERCAELLCGNDAVRMFLSKWIQSMAAMFDENLDKKDYDLACTAELWGDLLERLVTDERVYYGHPKYRAFLHEELRRSESSEMYIFTP